MRTWESIWEGLPGRRSEEVGRVRKRRRKSRGKGVFSRPSTVLSGLRFCWDSHPARGLSTEGAGICRTLFCAGRDFPRGVSSTLLGCTCSQAEKAASEKALGEKVHRIAMHSCRALLSTCDEGEGHRKHTCHVDGGRVARTNCSAMSL